MQLGRTRNRTMSGKLRSLSGSVAVGIFFVAFVCVCVAFATPAWLVSDYRITGAKLDRFGLWVHCFRSLPNPQEPDAPVRYFVGCRWIYDPFTAGYSEIRGFLLPGESILAPPPVSYLLTFIAFPRSFVSVVCLLNGFIVYCVSSFMRNSDQHLTLLKNAFYITSAKTFLILIYF